MLISIIHGNNTVGNKITLMVITHNTVDKIRRYRTSVLGKIFQTLFP